MDIELSESSAKDEMKEQYLLLKGEYAKLLVDKDTLLQCRKCLLEALYIVKIGNKQLELLQIRLEVKRLKKMCELAVASLNRKEPIDWDIIEMQVDAVLADDNEKIMEEASRVAGANYLLDHLASPELSLELRKLYYQIAKKLHPDVNPDLTETQKNLWYAVTQAYECGDLESLRALSVMVQDVELFLEELSIRDFQLQIELLKAGIDKLLSEITQIRSCFPFNVEKNLKNEEWVQQQNEEVAQLIKQELEQKKKYEERMDLIKSV